MRMKFIAIAVIALAVGLFFSHTFAYKTGINSVVVSTQAEALDQVAEIEKSDKVINIKDTNRYAALDKNHKALRDKYAKLLTESRAKVEPDDAEKYAVCTLDNDTLELLTDSASGGRSTGEADSIGSRSVYPVYQPAVARNWNAPGVHRTDYRKRQAVLRQSVQAPFSGGGGEGPPGSRARI